MDYRILTIEEQVVGNIDIAPSKGRISLSGDQPLLGRQKGHRYEQNTLFPVGLFGEMPPVIMRNVWAVKLRFHPFRYHPGKRELVAHPPTAVLGPGPPDGTEQVFIFDHAWQVDC